MCTTFIFHVNTCKHSSLDFLHVTLICYFEMPFRKLSFGSDSAQILGCGSINLVKAKLTWKRKKKLRKCKLCKSILTDIACKKNCVGVYVGDNSRYDNRNRRQSRRQHCSHFCILSKATGKFFWLLTLKRATFPPTASVFRRAQFLRLHAAKQSVDTVACIE